MRAYGNDPYGPKHPEEVISFYDQPSKKFYSNSREIAVVYLPQEADSHNWNVWYSPSQTIDINPNKEENFAQVFGSEESSENLCKG